MPMPRLTGLDPAAPSGMAAALRRGATLMLVCLSLLFALVSLPHAYDSQRLIAAAPAFGPRAVASAPAVQQLIAHGSRATDDSRIRATNQFYNDAITFVDDLDVWGVTDYWASPLEALGKGMGDCEDYSLAKYFSLVAMGMPVSKLRLVYVRALLDGPGSPGQPHMVVAFYDSPGAEPLILDNLVAEVRPASRRPDLVPVFSFNTEGMWQGVNGQSTGDASSRLSKWRDVLARARAQGF